LSQPISKSSLSKPQQRLVELLQQINFGRVESLRLAGGEPSFDPAPRVVQTLKMGGQNGPRDEAGLPDFWLKQPLVDLLATIHEIHDGEILAIEVRNGLPFTVEVERVQVPSRRG
jgi:hypothetical protein